uniref:Long-chain-fatty-acid--CoA ligase n=1 Tax=Meloidogyne hapla TaxID=6305 RepID=A0A1I8B9W8_MELHA
MGECQIEGPCTSQNNTASTIKHMTVSGTYSENKNSPNKPIITSSPNKNFVNNCDISDFLFELSIFCIFIGIFLADLLSWKTALFIYFVIRLSSNDLARRIILTIPRDLKGVILVVRIKWEMRLRLRQNKPLHEFFDKIVKQMPNKECLVEVDSGRKMTCLEFDQHSNKFANFFQKCHIGFESGDVISLFMENGIDFFAAWFGLSKIGIITAWINTNLKLEPLAHSIKVANCKAILTTRTLFPVLENALKKDLLPSDLTIFVAERGLLVEYKWVRNECFIREHPIDEIEKPEIPSNLNFQSILCYIYTSGTTGIPKAAVIRHFRYFMMTSSCGKAFNIKPSDRFYITLPMYHSSAGILATGQPSIPEERKHKIRLMFGNGLRLQIWQQFISRFGVQRMGEFYGSTEGNCNIINVDNNIGSCGFMPLYMTFLSGLYPLRLLCVDENGQLLRDENGFCVRCSPGECGEIAAAIHPNNPILRFEGYVDRSATKNKLIENCDRKGDTVFSSGDILYWDKFGYLYFKDRRGDTYRWKGENVSTTEVEGLLQSEHQHIVDTSVYGVEVPGREGRAGMIAIVLQDGTNIEEFINKLAAIFTAQLASYAIPVFLRICDGIEKTGTFKLKKCQLQNEGFDLEKCSGNHLFYWDTSVHKYKELSKEIQKDIECGKFSSI